MDFLERIFHVSPDHGSGLTEIAVFLVFMAVLLLIVTLRNRLKPSKSRQTL